VVSFKAPRNEPPIPTEYEARWTPEAVVTGLDNMAKRKACSLPLPGIDS